MRYEHRLVEAANGREFYDKIGRDADAEIAALTERLRAVEAERDEARKKLRVEEEDHAQLQVRCYEGFPSASDGIFDELSALRAELARKDAALKAERQCAENFAEQFAECQWIDMGSYFEVRGPVALMLDSEFAEQAYVARRAALQPKEPPCQTA